MTGVRSEGKLAVVPLSSRQIEIKVYRRSLVLGHGFQMATSACICLSVFICGMYSFFMIGFAIDL